MKLFDEIEYSCYCDSNWNSGCFDKNKIRVEENTYGAEIFIQKHISDPNSKMVEIISLDDYDYNALKDLLFKMKNNELQRA